MITTRRNERGLRAEALLQFKTQHSTIKFQRAFKIGHFQMHMADADAGMDGRKVRCHNLLQFAADLIWANAFRAAARAAAWLTIGCG